MQVGPITGLQATSWRRQVMICMTTNYVEKVLTFILTMILLEEYDEITVNDGAEPWLTPSRPDIGLRARFGSEIGG